MKPLAFALSVLAFASVSTSSIADSYPSRAVTLIVPTATGGSNTVVARLFAEKLQTLWGQTIIIENKPGAATAIGANFVAKSKPDGYTLLVTGGPTFTAQPLLQTKLPYKVDDFDYIAYTGGTPLVLLTNPQTGYKTVQDVVEAARKAPGQLAYGSFGSGSGPHFAGAALAQATGISLLHAPYKGSAPAMMDLIGNQIPLSIDTLTAALPQIQGKKVVPIAVTTATTSPHLPDTPTIAQSGLAGYNFSTWFVVAAPKGLPAAVAHKLTEDFRTIMAMPELVKALEGNGIDNTFMDGAGVRKLIDSELARNQTVMTQAGIKPNE